MGQQSIKNLALYKHVLPGIAAGLVLLTGMLVLLGWGFDIMVLKSISPAFVSMKANTALCFVLTGLAMWMLVRPERPVTGTGKNMMGRVSLLPAALVLVISLATLLQYLLNTDFGIDQWLFPDDLQAVHTYAPGRMALSTAISFLILSTALLLLQLRAGFAISLAQMLALFIALYSLLPILGYKYDVEAFYGQSYFTRMSIHAAVAFMAAGLGMLLCRPERGIVAVVFSGGKGGYLARRLIPASVLLPVLLLWGWLWLSPAGVEPMATDPALFFTILISLFVVLSWMMSGTLEQLEKSRSQAAEELKHWHQMMHYIIRHDPNAIAVHDTDLRYIFVSERYLSDYRLIEKNIIGKHHYEVFPDIPEKWKEVHRRALAGEVIGSEEDVFERADGSTDITRWECRPWYKHDGQTGGIVLYTEVITKRKQAEQALKSSQQLLQAIIDSADSFIYVTDLEGRYVLVNRALQSEFGHESAEIIGKTRDELINKVSARIHRSNDRKVIEAGRSIMFVEENIGKAGTRFYLTTKFPLFNADGKIYAVCGISTDITQRREMENEIREKNDFIQTVLDNLPIGIALNRIQDGEAIYMNKKFEEIYGWPQKELQDIDGFFRKVYPDETYRKSLIERVMTDIRSGDPEKMHWENIFITRQDGAQRIVNALNIPLVEQNTMVSTVMDVTRQKRAELELRTLNDQLIKLVATIKELSRVQSREEVKQILKSAEDKETVADGQAYPDHILETLADAASIALENVGLYEELELRVKNRTRELEDANKELEAFSYSVSHDLRAPLRAIDGFTRVLEEEYSGLLDDNGRRLCAIIRDNTRNMGQLIDDLLAFSRLGRTELNQAAIDMKAMAMSVFEGLSSTMDGQVAGFELQDIPAAWGDHALIRQVWANLISNAIKFTSTRKNPAISVSGNLENGRCLYRIEDNGVGFDMKYAGKIFGVFQRLHSHREFEGTGVGLAIVERILKKHGGSIAAWSEEGKGARFEFSLPFHPGIKKFSDPEL
jgi:PAS domain S-box-containing protein